ncbi:MAG: VOC family protein [Desulfobulbaceae bacterium]|nr:VOC family protein [Desulfobulbaceae bacterium]
MSKEKQKMDMLPGLVNWNETATKDLEGMKEIYTSQFGWNIEEMELPGGTYSFLKLGERLVGGMLQMPPEIGTPIMWMPYITVPNLRDAVAKSTSLGAKLYKDITPIPGLGRLAIITNRQGAAVGLWESGDKN